jgi:hypothetical protein
MKGRTMDQVKRFYQKLFGRLPTDLIMIVDVFFLFGVVLLFISLPKANSPMTFVGLILVGIAGVICGGFNLLVRHDTATWYASHHEVVPGELPDNQQFCKSCGERLWTTNDPRDFVYSEITGELLLYKHYISCPNRCTDHVPVVYDAMKEKRKSTPVRLLIDRDNDGELVEDNETSSTFAYKLDL